MFEDDDLFGDYENLPQAVKDIIESKDEDKNSYEENDRMIKELEPLGYVFDYGLCGEPMDLQLITNE